MSDDKKAPKGYADLTPLAGSTEATADGVRFTPRFPPQPGTKYRLIFDTFTAEFTVTKVPPARPTEVIRLHPATAKVPENLLRVYLHFNAPMSRGEYLALTRHGVPRAFASLPSVSSTARTSPAR